MSIPPASRYGARSQIGGTAMIDPERVKTRMEELGLNQHSAALLSSLPQDYIRDILRGRNKNPSASKLRALSRTLECSTDFLMGVTSEVGDAASEASQGRVALVQLPIKHSLSHNYQSRARTLKTTKALWFPPVTVDGDEWLEFALDDQLGGRFKAGTLLHVISNTGNISPGDYVIVESKTLDDRGTYQRYVREHSADPAGLLRLVHQVAVVGWVVRAYEFFDESFGEPEA